MGEAFTVHRAALYWVASGTQEHVTYFLVRCDSPERAKEIASELREKYAARARTYTAEEFSFRSRKYRLTRTKAGIAIGYAALLGLIVSAVITAQTLYSATLANAKEFAILPRWGSFTAGESRGWYWAQSFWVGIIGVGLAIPTCFVLRYAASQTEPTWTCAGGAAGHRHRAAGGDMVAWSGPRCGAQQRPDVTLLR